MPVFVPLPPFATPTPSRGSAASDNPGTDPGTLVILATFGTGGDLEPFILMARALQSRGDRVCLVTTRDHAPRLLESGLPHRLFGSVAQVHAMLDDPDLWDERKGLGVIGRGMAGSLDEAVDVMSDLASRTGCVVVCHPFMIPAAAIMRAGHSDVRIVGAWLAPSNLRSIRDPLMLGPRRIPAWVPLAWRRALWRFVDRYWIDNVMLPGINAVRAARGLAQVERFFDHLGASCDSSIALFPAWFAPRAPDWPTPFVEAGFPLAPVRPAAALSPAIERFLDAGGPPVVVTFGTGMRHAGESFAHCRAALSTLGHRGLFVSSHEAQRPQALPPEFVQVAQAPFASLLPRVAAIVHHGGIGTSAQALRAGIPQLVVASGFDQFDNGERLRALGVGDVLRATQASEAGLRRRLATLLASSSTRAACAAVKQQFHDAALPEAFVDPVVAAIRMARAELA
jgi:rhamnosyltransferase subunit B